MARIIAISVRSAGEKYIRWILVQTSDQVKLAVRMDGSRKPPDEKIWRDLEFCWKVCAHLKSNAIAVACNTTLGLGMGQVKSRDAVEHALSQSTVFSPQSTAFGPSKTLFFPFPDSIDLLARAGVKWVIQPGGLYGMTR